MRKRKSNPFSGRQNESSKSSVAPFETFLVIHRISGKNETFERVSLFLVQKAETSAIGEVTSIRKLRSGDLLVEVNSREQSQQLLKLKALESVPLSVSAHRTLNSSKGVITRGYC
ncbi:hypothetical protein AVEN_257799-1 [Araneus ventricosus]|uniref:Uncharacterized protein n=1 Tax=Araneus ventricosus TaxID=182803 RepID=A0A4Y2KER0_ARAVE|nr:hypothetical protein AVEN_257799-1 [Araneus ventricosus]